MGQLKFERKFSEKLNKREIEPKSESWVALSTRLESEDKRKNPVFWWVGIAATIIGGILIFGSFFNEPLPNNPEIVNVPVDVPEQDENRIQQKQEEVKPEAIAFEEKKELIETPAREKPSKVSEEQKPIISQNKGAVVAVNKSLRMKKPILEAELIIAEMTKIPHSVEGAIAEVLMPDNGGNSTDAEVDALLAEAGFQLNRSRDQKAISEKITANALLWDVEMEMEDSFRDKVFEVVKEGFFKAKTAMANRNNSF